MVRTRMGVALHVALPALVGLFTAVALVALSPTPVGVGLAGLALVASGGLVVRGARLALRADASGLTVRNLFATHRWTWDDLLQLRWEGAEPGAEQPAALGRFVVVTRGGDELSAQASWQRASADVAVLARRLDGFAASAGTEVVGPPRSG